MDKQAPNHIKVVSWNANGILHKKAELCDFLAKHSVDAILIQETFLKPHNKFKVPHFKIYRNDRLSGPKGGTAVLIKNHLKHFELHTPQTTDLETTSVQIRLANTNLRLISAYISPYKKPHLADFKAFFTPTGTPIIIGGDFNCKNRIWCNLVTNAKGRALQTIADSLLFTIHPPNEATFFGNNCIVPDFLDLFLSKDITLPLKIKVLHELSSDHIPVALDVGDPSHNNFYTKNFTNWNTFQHVLKNQTPIPPISDTASLDAAAEMLSSNIQNALNRAKITKTIQLGKYSDLPADVKEMIRQKNQLLKRAYRTRDPRIKREANLASQMIKNRLQQVLNDQWEAKLESLTPEDNSLWKMAKSLKPGKKPAIPSISTPNGPIASPTDKAELFATHLEKQFTPNIFDDETREEKDRSHRVQLTAEIILGSHTPTFPSPVSADEIESIIKASDRKKSNGYDTISNVALQKLPEVQIRDLTHIVNSCLSLCHFPKTWKHAEIILIHKKDSPRNLVTSYRPISLLSNLGKVAERIILGKIHDFTRENNCIPDEQYAFTPLHSTIHQTTRVADYILNAFNKSKHAPAVFLDVAKAFDKVWHPGLTVKLRKLKFPIALIKLIHSFISNRSFQVKIDDEISSSKTMLAGVPQGSPISPILYNLYTADIPRTTYSILGIYADDTAIVTQAKSRTAAIRLLQKHLNLLLRWFRDWKIKINPEKSQAILFSKGLLAPPKQLSILGHHPPWLEEAKYLGLIFDKKLIWKSHHINLMKKSHQLLGQFYPLINRKSKLSISNKLRIYKSYIRPILTYGCPTWSTLAPTRKIQLERVQNKILRIIADAPWFVKNATLHRDLQMVTLSEFMTNIRDKHFQRAEIHPNPTITQSHNYDLDVQLRFKRPRYA